MILALLGKRAADVLGKNEKKAKTTAFLSVLICPCRDQVIETEMIK